MKVIIIEDEKLSAEHLENLLKKIDSSIEIVSVVDSVKRSIEMFSKGVDADLLFVDIHLADGLSFDIFTKMEVNTPIVFTTAFDEYAIKAFKLNSVDYLLKPIGIEDLKGALSKFKKLKIINNRNIVEDLAIVYQNANKQYKSRFMVKMGDSITTIKSDEITHFVSEDGVVLLSALNGKRFMVDYTLDQLESLVSPESFFRINRKVLIHINSVQKVSSYFNSRLKINYKDLQEEDGIVSRERVSDFKKWLDK